MENFSPPVSVIVPVYNAEKYLPVCLESILNQTFTDFELLVVDDCSTDSSFAVAESFLERFGGRLKIVSLPQNTGSGSVPRNVGLDLSQGKYIYFVDNDDLLIDTALETLYDFAEEYQADFVCMERAFTCDENPIPEKLNDNISYIPPRFLVSEPIIETENLAERVEKFLRLSFGHQPWLKFLRRDFLVDNDIKLSVMKISDDNIWTFKIVCLAKKILRVPSMLYVHRTNTQSVMNKKRTPEQEVRHWINPLLTGVDSLNEFMNGFDLFNQPNNLRLYVLNFFAKVQFDFMAEAFKSLDRHEVYKIFFEEFSKSNGDHTALIAYLLVMTNLYRIELSK